MEVFNPLSAPEVTRAVGGVLRDAAAGGPDDDFRRGQLLSAYSICRHLAAEQEAEPALRSRFDAELGAIAAAAGEAPPAALGAAELGEWLCELMARLRAADDAASRRTLVALRGALGGLCDRELAALAKAA